MKKYSIQQLLDWLENTGMLKSRPHAEALLLCDANEARLPISQQIIISALTITVLTLLWFVYFKIDTSFFHQREVLLSLGGLLIGFSLISYYAVRNRHVLLKSFVLQLSLISMLAGKLFLILGISYLHFWTITIPSEWMYPIVILLVTVPLYFLYPVGIDRFISAVILLFGAMYYTVDVLILNVICALGLAAIYVWFAKLRHNTPFWDPIMYAAISVISVLFIALIYLTVAEPLTAQKFTILSALSVVIYLAFALNLLISGYYKHDKVMMGWGYVMLTFAIGVVFYRLELSVRETALTMIGVGVVFVVLYGILRKFDIPVIEPQE